MSKNYLKIKNIPPMPQVAERVLSIDEEDVDFGELEKLIILDQGLSSKILQVANSAFYARPKEITSIKAALTLLGIRTVKSLAFMIINSNLWNKIPAKKISDLFHKHAIHTAFFAREIGGYLGIGKEMVEEIFMIGLMHDVGKTLMVINYPDEYKQVEDKVKTGKYTYVAAEKEVLGFDHTEVGRFVAEKWNLAPQFVDIISNHHNLEYSGDFKRENYIVGLSNHLSKQLGYGNLTPEIEEEVEILKEKLALNTEDINNIEERMKNTIEKDPYYLTVMEIFKQIV